ncbi:MAG: hypothetical protein ACRD4J_10560, partial [Nitrososphaeraceae archaeon]
MNQTGTARSIMFAIVAIVIVFSVSGFLDGHLLQTAYATHPGHQLGSGSLGSDMTAQQLTTAVDAQAASTNAACGQVVSGVVNLTANLNCSSGDGIIVGGPNTVINMNGFSITGPGQDSSKVAIMVPNVDNVVVNGPGSLSNFQAGVLLTGANGFQINSVILSNNQIGTFMTGAENAQVQQNIIQGNSIGVASHSSTGS